MISYIPSKKFNPRDTDDFFLVIPPILMSREAGNLRRPRLKINKPIASASFVPDTTHQLSSSTSASASSASSSVPDTTHQLVSSSPSASTSAHQPHTDQTSTSSSAASQVQAKKLKLYSKISRPIARGTPLIPIDIHQSESSDSTSVTQPPMNPPPTEQASASISKEEKLEKRRCCGWPW